MNRAHRAHRIVPGMLAVLFFIAAQGAAGTLWSIGKADQTGKEFALFGKCEDFPSSYPRGFTFKVGTTPDHSWPFIHPGPIDKWAGSRTHDLKIRFRLDSPPAGTCVLVINAVSVHSRTPTMRVRINDHEGRFRCGGGGDSGAAWDESKKTPMAYRFEFLPSLLRRGQNEIVLSVTTGCWVLYDEVHLEAGESPVASGLVLTKAEPSLCHVRSAAGDCPAVRVTAVNRAGERVCETVARCGEQVRSSRVRLTVGENILYAPVPPVLDGTPVALTLRAGNDVQTTGTFVKPGRKWRLHVVPSIHTDIGYTDRQADVFKRHNDNLDKVLAMCRKNPSLKWNIEVAWEVENYLAGRPRHQRNQLLAAMRSGRIGLQAGYLNFLTALMSDEAMIRYALYAKELERRYGISFESALMTDIPSAGWGLCSAMSGSGIRYFAQGCNADRGPMLPNSGIRTPFYWEGPDGVRVVAWLTNSYAQSRGLAEPQDLVGMQEYVAECVKPYDCPEYPYDDIYVYGAFFDNAEVNENYAALVGDWNRKIAWPKIVFGDGTAFFRSIDEQSHDKDRGVSLPVHRGDFGAFWEDGAGSTAFETALHMGNQRRASSAEALWALARLADSSVRHPAVHFRQAWKDILFYAEHTWGAAGSVSAPDDAMTRDQWEFKGRYAHAADRETRELERDGMQAYLRTVPAERGDIVVANTMSWPRSGLVEMPEGISRNARITDAAGSRVPLQIMNDRVVAHVAGVPAFGHKILKLQQGTDEPVETTGSLENTYYSLQLDPRLGIASIVDKQSERELIDRKSPYAFGQIVYAAGGEGTRIMQHTVTSPTLVVLNHDGRDGLQPAEGTLLLTRANVSGAKIAHGGPVFSEARIASSAPSMPQIETIVRLFHHEKRLSLEVRITSKTEIRHKEAVYVAFPFATTRPELRLGMTNAVADPTKDFIHGACHEWYCVQDFVSCRDAASGREIVWCSPDAPLVTLSDVNRGLWLADADISTPTLFSYAMNNYWHTNYKAGQGGDFRFRYELTSDNADVNDADALRWARHVASPMIASVAARDTRLPARPVGLSVEGALASLVCGDSGDTILRLRNADQHAGEAKIGLGRDAARRFRLDVTNLVGGDRKELHALSDICKRPLRAGEIETVRISERRRAAHGE